MIKEQNVCYIYRGNDKPFGGIQLILSGDFLQLPPVVKGTVCRRSNDPYFVVTYYIKWVTTSGTYNMN